MTTARETRGNTAEIPREVIFLAIAREFRGNGNRNPASTIDNGQRKTTTDNSGNRNPPNPFGIEVALNTGIDIGI
jgi:hypothetical protein